MKNKKQLLTAPYIIWIIGFTILPILILLGYAMVDAEGHFTTEYVLAIFDIVHLKALWLSIKLSVICTVICILLAYPMALCMRKMHLGKQGMMVMIVLVPMWMNFVLRIMAWQLILSKNGFLNAFLGIFGLHQDWGNSQIAIVIGMVYDYLPFMILPIYNAVMDVGEDVMEAAHDLGANFWEALFRVMIPMTIPGIISGITMVFIPALTTFAISDTLGGGKVMLIGNVIEQEFVSTMNWRLGSGLSIALMIFALCSMFLAYRTDKSADLSGMSL